MGIIDTNKLIAVFMGGKLNGQSTIRLAHNHIWLPKHGICNYHTIDIGNGKTLHYHDSYDWLIPVVQKIAKIPDGIGYQFKRGLDGALFIDISTIYESVIEFIKWYNEYLKSHIND